MSEKFNVTMYRAHAVATAAHSGQSRLQIECKLQVCPHSKLYFIFIARRLPAYSLLTYCTHAAILTYKLNYCVQKTTKRFSSFFWSANWDTGYGSAI